MIKLILNLPYLKRLVVLWVDKLILKMEKFKIDCKFLNKNMDEGNLIRRADCSPMDYLSLKPSSEISFEYVV